MDDNMIVGIAIRDDLVAWQKLKATAHLMSGIAAKFNDYGPNMEDGNGIMYLPTLQCPMYIFSAYGFELKRIHSLAVECEVEMSIFTPDQFLAYTKEYIDPIIKELLTEVIDLAGIAIIGDKITVIEILRGIKLHQEGW